MLLLLSLAYLRLVSHKKDIGKQCWPDQMPQFATYDHGLHYLKKKSGYFFFTLQEGKIK